MHFKAELEGYSSGAFAVSSVDGLAIGALGLTKDFLSYSCPDLAPATTGMTTTTSMPAYDFPPVEGAIPGGETTTSTGLNNDLGGGGGLGGGANQAILTTNPPALGPVLQTPAPTTPRGGGGASLHGDPHVQNMAGKRFDIFQEGPVQLLRLPRKAEETPLLSVVGTMFRGSGGACYLWMRELEVKGTWAGALSPLRLATDGSARKPGAIQIHVGSQDEDVGPQELARRAPAVVNVTASTTLASWRRKYRMLAMSLRFDKVRLWVEWNHRKRVDDATSFLNLGIEGLAEASVEVQGEVGGALGKDNWRQFSKKPASCGSRAASLLSAGRSLVRDFEEMEDTQRGSLLMVL